MNQSDLHHRFKQLSNPLKALPTGTVPNLRELTDIKVIAYDFYGTLFISGVGDIGIDDGKLDPTLFLDVLKSSGIEVISKDVATKGFNIYNNVVQQFIEKFSDEGIEYPEPDIREVWGHVLKRMKTESLIEYHENRQLLDQISIEFESRMNPVWPMPGVIETLHHFKDLGIPQGIISNSQFYTPIVLESLTEQSLTDLGFSNQLLHWSYEEKMKKPGLPFYKNYLHKLNAFDTDLVAENVLFIGNDMLKDIWPAHSIGMKTALFAGDKRSLKWRKDDKRCKHLKPDLIITEMIQLKECIHT
ncbi:MAG: HAD hydrolase-like protein [Balneolaceae bacterium]